MQLKSKKSYKVFLKIFLLITFLYVTTFLYIKYFPIYYNRENNNNWYYLNQVLNKNIDISDSSRKYIFLGESRLNAALDFSKILDSWAFAYGGTSPVEQYFILKKYLENYSNPDTVFYSVSPRFLTEIFAFWQFAVRNDFFTKDEFDEIISDYENLNDTVLGFAPKFNFFLYNVKYIGYYQVDIYKNFLFFGKNDNNKNINLIQTHRGQSEHYGLLDSCSDLNYETKYSHFTPSAIMEIYFEKILNLCKEKNIKLIFLFMPMNKSSYINLNSSFVTEYITFIQKYQTKFPEFEISDTLFYYEDSFFGDASHLNSKGKQIFTNQIIEKYFQ